MPMRKSLNKKPSEGFRRVSNWVQGLDLNQRPSGYEPDELPGCSTLQRRARNVRSTIFTVNLVLEIVPLRTCQSLGGSLFWTAPLVNNHQPPDRKAAHRPTCVF